jgi:hypothetical protein
VDPVELANLVLSGTLVGLFVLLLLGIRALPSIIEYKVGQFAQKLLWEDTIEEVDGKKVTVRRPNPAVVAQIQALVPVLAPVLMKEAGTWAQKNLLKPGSGGSAGGAGGFDLANMDPTMLTQALGMKKSQAGLVSLAMPLIQRFLGGALGGPKAAATTTTATVVPANPFMK